MKKSELLEILESVDDGTEIMVEHVAGDRWRTRLASPITDGEFGKVTHSSYHQQDKVIGPMDNVEEDEDNHTEVFLLKISQKY